MIRPRNLALFLLAALPLAAQFGVGPTERGLRLKVREAGSAEWMPETANGRDRLQAGQVGSGRPLDGLTLKHMTVPLRVEIATAKGWQGWSEGGLALGTAGEPITAVRVKAEKRAIRYRGSFVGKGVGEWARDGEAATAGGAALEAIDVELLNAAPADAPDFEYRVSFAGTGFTAWKKPGEPAEGPGPEPSATAIEVRGADLKIEARPATGGWGPTAGPGETAGDPSGKRALGGLRVFSQAAPLRYRVKTAGLGWGTWQTAGGDAGAAAPGQRIEGIQLDWRR